MQSEIFGSVRCWIYRSSRKDEMYLYLSEESGFDRVPDDLMRRFGAPTLVMELELRSEKQLAREDVRQVMENLKQRGFHLQLPPVLQPDLYFGD